MYKLVYDENNNQIIQIDPNGNSTVIANEFSSEPVFSPDKEKAVYIYPLEWEVLGSLYLYNLINGQITKLIAPDEKQNIPKYVDWIDNDNLAVIIGFGMGTVAVGGDVFIYNLSTKSLKKVTNYQPRIQITKIKIINDFIELIGIEYIDDNYNQFRDFKEKLPLNSFLSL